MMNLRTRRQCAAIVAKKR